MTAMELERHPLIRRLLVVAILGVIVALFVQREMLSNDATGGTDGETALGMLTANTPEIGSLERGCPRSRCAAGCRRG